MATKRAQEAEGRPFNPAHYAKALLNILEDSAGERVRLEMTQKAVLNILDDAAEERGRQGMTQKAILNILEDAAGERAQLEKTQKAVLNVLEDAAEERGRQGMTQKAILNILEDAADERARLEKTQKAVLNILEDFGTEKVRLEAIQKAILNILDDLANEMEERKRAEESLRQRTVALEAANKELEAFAYSVSHDLRAPLRAIDGFSRKVVASYGNRLDDEGRRQLQVVRDGALNMGRLIDDLLAFSRMGRREMALQPLNMDAMVRGVAEELRITEPERKILFIFATLPPVHGDAAMLRQVWANLLGNAVKFTRHREVAHIEVGGSVEGNDLVYWVKDDGAGFDMQYADKLFGIFQRLHRQDEFEGTGVGLAIAQRILYRHNGRIWGEGEPGAGAIFRFSLPLSVSDNDPSEGPPS